MKQLERFERFKQDYPEIYSCLVILCDVRRLISLADLVNSATDSNEPEAAPETVHLSAVEIETLDTIIECEPTPDDYAGTDEYYAKEALLSIGFIRKDSAEMLHATDTGKQWFANHAPETKSSARFFVQEVTISGETTYSVCELRGNGESTRVSRLFSDRTSAEIALRELTEFVAPETVAGETDSGYDVRFYRSGNSEIKIGNRIVLEIDSVTMPSITDFVDVLNAELASLRAVIRSKNAQIAALEAAIRAHYQYIEKEGGIAEITTNSQLFKLVSDDSGYTVRNGVNVANTPDGIRIERDALMDTVEDYNRMYKEATERAFNAEAKIAELEAENERLRETGDVTSLDWNQKVTELEDTASEQQAELYRLRQVLKSAWNSLLGDADGSETEYEIIKRTLEIIEPNVPTS